jgi:hypothetical protein
MDLVVIRSTGRPPFSRIYDLRDARVMKTPMKIGALGGKE